MQIGELLSRAAIALGAVAVLVGAALLLTGAVGAVFWKRPHDGCCPECDYPLEGLPDGRCPECGRRRPLSPAVLERVVERLGLDRADRLMARGAVLMSAGGALVLMGW